MADPEALRVVICPLGAPGMNLHYLLSRKHKRLDAHEAVTPSAMAAGGRKWRGATLPAGTGVTVRKATECDPFRQRASTVGWYACSRADGGVLNIRLRDSSSGALVESSAMPLSGELREIRIPWPKEPLPGHLDLEIASDADASGDLFVAANHVLDRPRLIRMCIGKGVEIGPGPRPQVLPTDSVDVSYVEQTHPERWGELYGGGAEISFDPILASRYVVGDANRIPAEAGSLDFIFSSHVFEHLANPLGHLEQWARLLKPGGRIVMVIPDYIGSKDFLMEETALDELLSEYRAGSFEVTSQHYQAYGRARESAEMAERLEAASASIHVHFYSNAGMSRVCRWAVENLGYGAFSIEHVQNSKDFHVVLVKA